MKTTTLPSADLLKQFDDAVQAAPQATITLARIATERGAVTLAAKAASARRELTRAAAAGASKERLERFRSLASSYAERAGQAAEDLKMAQAREKIGAAYGQRPAAYGRAVDEKGRGYAGLPVALVTERGQALVDARTDEDGYFALSLAETPDAAGGVLVRVGEYGSLGTFPVTSNGRLLPPREILVSGSRGGSEPTVPPKKD